MILGKWPTWRTILFYVFISVLYMFRATSCSSSGESIVSIQHLVYVTLCWWPFRMQIGKFFSDLHTKRSPIQSDIYQMLYWYNWFFWWCARGCSKHVENWNKYIEKNCASSWSFTKKLLHKLDFYSFLHWLRTIAGIAQRQDRGCCLPKHFQLCHLCLIPPSTASIPLLTAS